MTRLSVTDEGALADAVSQAKAGNRGALEQVVRAVQDDVYRLALRMTAHPQDAEDACQEILVKVITRLDGFRGDSSVRTWVYSIAVRHMLDRKKSRVESFALDFEHFGADLLDGLASTPDPDPVMANEVKLGCTLAMLTVSTANIALPIFFARYSIFRTLMRRQFLTSTRIRFASACREHAARSRRSR